MPAEEHFTVVVEFEPLALIAEDRSVWVTVLPRWWDLASLIWWWLCPADKRAWVVLRLPDGRRSRVRAIRIATRSAQIAHLNRVK